MNAKLTKKSLKKDVLQHTFENQGKDNNLFSFYKNVFTLDFQTITPFEFYQAIRVGKYKNLTWIEQIKKLRTTKDKKYKTNLPVILTSCTVPQSHRKEIKNITNSLPFIQIDFDNVKKPTETKTLLNKDKFTFISFISPSDTGVKVIVKIDTNKDFLSVFKYLEKYYKNKYDLTIDPNCKNINRLMFVSYDKNAYYNDKADICDKEIKPKPKKTHFKPISFESNTNSNKIIKRHIERKFNEIQSKLQSTPIGYRHNELTKNAYLLGGYIAGGFFSFSEAECFLHSVVSQIFADDSNLKTELKTATQSLQKGQNKPITKDQVLTDFEVWKKNNSYKFIPKNNIKKQTENVKYDKIYKANNYISELSNELLKEITENKKLLIVAPTGTGKTYTIIKKLLPKLQTQNKSVLLALPLRSLTDEVASTYNITAIKGGTDKNDIQTAVEDGLAVATYDKALQIAHKFDYIIVDEAHNFLSSFSYRSKTILNLWNNTKNKNIIFITATPPQNLYQFLEFRQIKINVKNHKPENVEIRKGYKNEVDTALTHILNSKTNGTTFIKINSKNKLLTLKDELIKHNKASASEIVILDSNISQRIDDKINYDFLVENNKFQSNVKYILSTSYINDGFNIKDENIKEVLSIENQHTPDPNEYRQFIARFRIHEQIRFTLYLKEQKEKKQTVNVDIEYTKLINETQKIIDNLNDLKGVNLATPFNELDVLKLSKNIILNENTNNYEVNKISVLYEIYKRSVNGLNTHEFIDYLTVNYKLKFNFDNYNFINDIDKTEHDKEQAKDNKKERTKVFYNELKNNKIELFKYVAKCTRKKQLKKDLKEFENIIVVKDEVLNISDNHIKIIINHFSEIETLVKRYLYFRRIDLPEKNIIHTLFFQKDNQIKKRSDIKFNELLNKILINYLLLAQTVLNDKISILNIDFLKRIINVFKLLKGKELYSSEIKDLLKNVLNESQFLSMYKNNRFYLLIETLFHIEKIKVKKDVYKYKIIDIKKPDVELIEILKKIEFSDEKKQHKKTAVSLCL